MKKILWTSLFWIIVFCAGLVCLGFFDFVNPVVSPMYWQNYLPSVVKEDFKDQGVIDFQNSEEFMDSCQNSSSFCTIAQQQCELPTQVVEATGSDMQAELVSLRAGIESLRGDIKNLKVESQSNTEVLDAVAQVSQQISGLKLSCSYSAVDQRKAEIQQQIEALQQEMNAL